MRIKNLVLITGNPGKAKEFKDLINIDNLEFSHQSMDLPEIQGMDVEEIGTFKIKSALKQINSSKTIDAVLTDDTALTCKGLNGLPGPLIKWFLDSLGAEGIVDLLKGKSSETRATCLLSLGLVTNGEIIHFSGDVDGHLVSPKGSGGFGWDVVFQPDSSKKTYGEMVPEEKNKISHRTLAVAKLREWILRNQA